MESTKDIKRLGIFSIIVSIFFFLIFAGSVAIEIAVYFAIKNTEGWVVIFVILIGIVVMFIGGIVGFISLILFILNLSTGITVVRNSSSVDELYKRKGRIKFSIWILRITAVILIIAGILLLLVTIKSFQVMYLVIMIACFALGIASFVLVNKANTTFRDFLKIKEAESL